MSPDRLVALCDEMAALARIGLPLEEALTLKSREERGRLGAELGELARSIGTGKSLADAVRDDPRFPPVCAAVIEAGLASNNLSGALDALAQALAVLRDTRRFLIQAAMYPMVLFTSLWIVFTGLFLFLGPRYVDFFDGYDRTTPLLGAMRFAQDHAAEAAVILLAVPVALWLLFFVWVFQSGRSNTLQTVGRFTLFGWIPWVGRATFFLQKTVFARILALLVRCSVPLDRALLLAARCCNDRFWSEENIDALRRRIVDGPKNHFPASPFSTLIEWSLRIPDQAVLMTGLDRYAEMARLQANLLLSRCEIVLPALLTFIIAVLVGVCYFLTVFWPYIHIFYFLSAPE